MPEKLKQEELEDFYFDKNSGFPRAVFRTTYYYPVQMFTSGERREHCISKTINFITEEQSEKEYYTRTRSLEEARREAQKYCIEKLNKGEIYDLIIGKEEFLKKFTDPQEHFYRISFRDLVDCLVKLSGDKNE